MESQTGSCSTCGADTGPEHAFCPECGRKLDDPVQVEFSTPSVRTKKDIKKLKEKYRTKPVEFFYILFMLPAVFAFFSAAGLLIAGNFPGAAVLGVIWIVLQHFGVSIQEYRNWARYGLCFLFLLLSFIFFVVPVINLGWFFLLTAIVCWVIFFTYSPTARLFTIDWRYDIP